MTREEAIKMLKSKIDGHTDTSYEWAETVRMAIKALEQDNVLDKIRAEIEALIEWHDCPIEYDNGNDAWYREACNQAIKIIDKYKAESEDKE